MTAGPANLLHHRETDPAGSDYRKNRYIEEREVILKRDNSLQKWATTVFLAGVISVVGYLLARDRFGIDVQFGRLDQAIGIIDSRVDRNSTDLELLKAQQAQVASDIKDIRAMMREQSRLSIENGKTLERLLALQRNRQ